MCFIVLCSSLSELDLVQPPAPSCMSCKSGVRCVHAEWWPRLAQAAEKRLLANHGPWSASSRWTTYERAECRHVELYCRALLGRVWVSGCGFAVAQSSELRNETYLIVILCNIVGAHPSVCAHCA